MVNQPFVFAAGQLGVTGSKLSTIGPFGFISGNPTSLVIEPISLGQSSCHSYSMSVITEKCFMTYYTDRTTTARLERIPRHQKQKTMEASFRPVMFNILCADIVTVTTV